MKDKMLSIRVTAGEKECIDLLCKSFDLSMTDLLVRVALNNLLLTQFDKGYISESKVRKLSAMLNIPKSCRPVEYLK